MTDITVSAVPDRSASADTAPAADAEPCWDLIELLFFAYRDFVGDADDILAHFGFGRAHHRVLHFVNRHPGMRVADLLDILKITKQSLGRVLKQLVDQGYIIQKAGRARPPPAPALRHRQGRGAGHAAGPAADRAASARRSPISAPAPMKPPAGSSPPSSTPTAATACSA